jgi:hypothetical protein
MALVQFVLQKWVWFTLFCRNEPEIILSYDSSAEREGSVSGLRCRSACK